MLTSPDKAILRHISKFTASRYIDKYTLVDSSDKEWLDRHISENHVPGYISAHNPLNRLFCVAMFSVGCPIAQLAHIYGVSRQSVHARITRFRELTGMIRMERENYYPSDRTDQFMLLPICKDLFENLADGFGRLDPGMIGSLVLSKAYEIMKRDNTEVLTESVRVELPAAEPSPVMQPKKHTFAPLSAAEILAQARKPSTDSNLNKGEDTIAPLTEPRPDGADSPLKQDELKALEELTNG